MPLEAENPDAPWATVIADGTPLVLRPIVAADAPGLVRFHAGLSPETIHRRFFGAHPVLTREQADHFCGLDQLDRFALVAVAGTAIVGVARMDRLVPTSTAEVAFVIADAFQHQGLGTMMAQRLAPAAMRRGITEFIADTLSGNRAMLHLLPDAGLPVTVSYLDNVARITATLAPSIRPMS